MMVDKMVAMMVAEKDEMMVDLMVSMWAVLLVV